MKILLPVLVLMGADMISMAEQTNSIAFYRERVQSIEAEARKNGAKDEVGFIDAYFVLGRKEAYVGFQKEMAASSEFILAHLDAIASTEYQKAIIAMSTWEMTRATFVTFLNAMQMLWKRIRLIESSLSGLRVQRRVTYLGSLFANMTNQTFRA